MSSGQLSHGSLSEAALERRLALHCNGLRADIALAQRALVSRIDAALDERRVAFSPLAECLEACDGPTGSFSEDEEPSPGQKEEMQTSMTSAGTPLYVPETEPWGLRRVVQSPAFDILCGVIISLNIALICAQAQQAMDWAMEHVGQGEGTEAGWSMYMNYFFVGFYTLEIILKMSALRCDFWKGQGWKWNLFDFCLVLFAWFDVFADVFALDSHLNQTWLRGFRLLKMLKMLRVIRVMRFFRELRNIVAAIVGSIATLVWAILAISLMMFVFGLALLGGLSTYLSDTPPSAVSEAFMTDVNTHWGSVPMAILTLYKATSGGSDWEPLAAPFQEAGAMYYGLFLGYIALSMLAVLNVVTGIFVDNAMTVVGRDAQLVLEEIMDRPEITALRRFLWSQDPTNTGMLSKKTLRGLIADKNVTLRKFLDVVQLGFNDASEVFLLLSSGGMLGIEEFILGCTRLRADLTSIDSIAINSSVKRLSRQFEVTMEFVDEEFQRLRREIAQQPTRGGLVLKDRLQRARCLPRRWGNGRGEAIPITCPLGVDLSE